MSALRESVRGAVLQALQDVPEPLRSDPTYVTEEVVNAALGAIQGVLLADLGKAGAAITSLELQIMDDCRPPDMGVPASVS